MKTIFRTIIIASAALLAAACGSNAGKQTEQQTAAVVAEDPTVAVVEVFTREVPQEAVYALITICSSRVSPHVPQ